MKIATQNCFSQHSVCSHCRTYFFVNLVHVHNSDVCYVSVGCVVGVDESASVTWPVCSDCVTVMYVMCL